MKIYSFSLSKSIFNQKLQLSKINEQTFSKIYYLLEKFSKLDPNQISGISNLLSYKKDISIQTDEIEEKNLVNKISILEKENEKLLKEKNKLKSEYDIINKENAEENQEKKN